MPRPWLYILVAPIPLLTTVRGLSQQLGDGGAAELLNFSVPVCFASAPNTVVAYGGGTGPVDGATVAYLEGLLVTVPALQNVGWVRCANDGSYRIAATSDADTQLRIEAGEKIYWDMNAALTKVGMAIWKDPNAVP